VKLSINVEITVLLKYNVAMAVGAKYMCFTEIKADSNRTSDVEDVTDSNCIPEPRSGHRIVVDQGNLYSIGGYNPDFSDRENDNDTYYPLFKVLFVCFLEITYE